MSIQDLVSLESSRDRVTHAIYGIFYLGCLRCCLDFGHLQEFLLYRCDSVDHVKCHTQLHPTCGEVPMNLCSMVRLFLKYKCRMM